VISASPSHSEFRTDVASSGQGDLTLSPCREQNRVDQFETSA